MPGSRMGAYRGENWNFTHHGSEIFFPTSARTTGTSPVTESEISFTRLPGKLKFRTARKRLDSYFGPGRGVSLSALAGKE